MNPNYRNLALWAIIAVLLIALFNLFQTPQQRGASSEIAYSEFLTEMERARAVHAARYRDQLERIEKVERIDFKSAKDVVTEVDLLCEELMVAAISEHGDPVAKVTILPAGQALGAEHDCRVTELGLDLDPDLSELLLKDLTPGQVADLLEFLVRQNQEILANRIPELYVACLGTLKNRSVFSPLFSAFGPEPVVVPYPLPEQPNETKNSYLPGCSVPLGSAA